MAVCREKERKEVEKKKRKGKSRINLKRGIICKRDGNRFIRRRIWEKENDERGQDGAVGKVENGRGQT